MTKLKCKFKRKGDRYRGELTRVWSRRETKTVFRQALLKLEFCLERNDLKVKNGDWVTARILTYPEHMRGFQGEVEAVIGDLAELTQRMIIYVFSAAAGNSPHVFT